MNEIFNIERFSLFDYVPVGICIINKRYEVIFWNYCIEYWTDINRTDIIGKTIFEYFPKLSEFKYKSRIDTIFDGGPPTVFSSQLHKALFPSQYPQNKQRIQHTSVSAVPSTIHKEHYALFSVEDVTSLSQRLREYRLLKDKAMEEVHQRRLAEDALRESEKTLIELNATKDKFFSIMAHDIKNPLGLTLNLSQYLYSEFDTFSNEEIKDFIQNIMNSSKGLFALLEDLLNWARAQTGRIEFNPSNYDISLLVQNCLQLLKINAQKKDISLFSNISEKTYAYFDFNMINTVLRNLISNAIKFTPENGKVFLKAKINNDFLEVSVNDTGIGLSPTDITKLFRIDVHHTTIGTSKEKGTGLGLIICKEFVEKNNGKIWVESELDKGTSFYFTLPMNPNL